MTKKTETLRGESENEINELLISIDTRHFFVEKMEKVTVSFLFVAEGFDGICKGSFD